MNESPTASGIGGVAATPMPPARRAAILTARLGVIQALLLLASFWLLSGVPGPKATDQEMLAFYSSGQTRLVVIAGLYLMPFAGIAFLWFAIALRMWISTSTSREDALLSNVQLVSAIVFIALFFAGAAAQSVLAVTVEISNAPVEVVLGRQFPQYGSALLLVFAMRMAAMFVFTTSNIARKYEILPRWFIWLGFVVGLFLLLSASLSRVLVLVFPAWVLSLSILLLLRARDLPRTTG
jgi:hypothetical protein